MPLLLAIRTRLFMKLPRASLILFVALLFALPLTVHAKGGSPEKLAMEQDEGAHQLGWEAMKDPAKVGGFFVTILGSIALAALLGFHPFHRELSLEDMDHPKTIITYAVVGTFAALIVTPVPALAYVIFGIGGLLRFRTDVGTAKNTGRAILGTMIGLACGMGFWLPAIFGTVVAWILFAVLEYRVNLRMTVRNVKEETFADTLAAYSTALSNSGCRIVAIRKNPRKEQLVFVMQAKRSLQPDTVETQCGRQVPAHLQGTIDWPEK